MPTMIFTYNDGYGYSTTIEKTWKESDLSEFDALLDEVGYALVACGFARETIEKNMNLTYNKIPFVDQNLIVEKELEDETN